MKKSFKTKLALLSLVSAVTISSVMAIDYAGGDASVTTNGNETIIQHAEGQRVFNNNWNNFNLNSNQTANFKFNGQNQISVNRVLGNEMSTIYGTIKSTGVGASTSHIILSNPNGLVFGEGSLVNVNAFTATTHDVTTTKVGDDVKVDFANKHNGKVTIDRSTWAINKSAAVVAKDIDVKDSYIMTRTGTNAVDYKGSLLSTEQFNDFNSIASADEAVLSNVKLISNDGVTFELKKEHGGAIKNDVGSPDNLLPESLNTHTINVENSKIASGSVQMHAGGDKNSNSNITVKNSAVKGVKLVNFAYGDISIVSKGKVNITGGDIETMGSYQLIDGKIARNTFEDKARNVEGKSINISKDGGAISISGDYGVDIDNTSIKTVASNRVSDSLIQNDIDHGGVAIVSKYDGVNIKNNSNISSYGSLYISAFNNVNISDSSVNAIGKQDAIAGVTPGFEHERSMYITGRNINLKNAQLKSNGNVSLVAMKDINVSNDKTNGIEAGNKIYLHATNDLNINNTVLKADKTSLYAKQNINLDKVSLQSYKDGVTANVGMTAADGSVKTAKDSFLKVNGNKLVVRAGKDVKLDLKEAKNAKAGIEVYAGLKEEGATTLNALDGTLSIARIETDKLNLNANNKFIADNNNKTAVEERAYIQVRKYGGFNLDSKPEYVGKKVENVNYEENGWSNPITYKVDSEGPHAYGRHKITMDDNAKFTLDYKKPVKCEEPPVVDPDPVAITYDDLTKVPLQAANPTLASKISNNTTDPTSGVIAAAAAIEIDEDEQLDY